MARPRRSRLLASSQQPLWLLLALGQLHCCLGIRGSSSSRSGSAAARTSAPGEPRPRPLAGGLAGGVAGGAVGGAASSSAAAKRSRTTTFIDGDLDERVAAVSDMFGQECSRLFAEEAFRSGLRGLIERSEEALTDELLEDLEAAIQEECISARERLTDEMIALRTNSGVRDEGRRSPTTVQRFVDGVWGVLLPDKEAPSSPEPQGRALDLRQVASEFSEVCASHSAFQAQFEAVLAELRGCLAVSGSPEDFHWFQRQLQEVRARIEQRSCGKARLWALTAADASRDSIRACSIAFSRLAAP